VKVANCYDPSSACTLTCVKMIEITIESVLPPILNDSQ
jgi:hypothetical protein